VLFLARLAFDDVSDLGATALLLRRGVQSIVASLPHESISSDLLDDRDIALAALRAADLLTPELEADVEKAFAVAPAVPIDAEQSEGERGKVRDALAAAARIEHAVERWHAARDARPRWPRRVAAGAVAVLVILVAWRLVGRVFARPGLEAVYYADTELGKAVLHRTDDTVDFVWDERSPDPEVPVDNFSVEWKGKLLVPEAAEYEFSIIGDDGARLYIDDELVIDRWGQHNMADGFTRASVSLAKGRVPLKVEYFEKTGGAAIRLLWRSKRIPEQPIAAEYLSH
jgi:hypothetical protein